MSNKTLSLKKEPQATYIPTEEEVAAFFASRGVKAPSEPSVIIPPTSIDWKYDAPIASNPFDFSKVPEAGARNCEPLQAPQKIWGDPSLLRPAARPGPQPLFTPPRGR